MEHFMLGTALQLKYIKMVPPLILRTTTSRTNGITEISP